MMSEDDEVTISYLILCHDNPDRIVRLITRILSDDETGQVIIHFDKNSSRAKFDELKTRLHGTSRCHILENRVRCGWGQWSLVESSLLMLKYSLDNIGSEYNYLLSEVCYPLTKLDSLKKYLYSNRGADFIESQDCTWIKGGITHDRYLYRHIFNKNKYPRLHKYSYLMQKKLSIKKNVPQELSVRFGSQWWCLTKETCGFVLNNRDKYSSLFKYSWIPDECFFQTLVNLQDRTLLGSLTYYEFDKNGKPKIYKSLPFKLVEKHYFFIRKYSNE